jgi:hypothetical protein
LVNKKSDIQLFEQASPFNWNTSRSASGGRTPDGKVLSLKKMLATTNELKLKMI